jgi:hypothetical protein
MSPPFGRIPLLGLTRRRPGRLGLAVVLALGALPGSAAPVGACSSMAPRLDEVAVSAQVVVRAEVAKVRGPAGGRRYDLRVLEVLKGQAPPVIRGFQATGTIRGGVCDEGWAGGDVGDPVFLFLGTTEVEGTVYHRRLAGRSWADLTDGLRTASPTADGVRAEFRSVVPTRRALVPDALYLANAIDGSETEPTTDIRVTDTHVRLLHHTDGQLSLWAWRAGGRRVDRFVIRAGDLATPGPVLFRFTARNSVYEAWAVGPAREAFRRSSIAPDLGRALAVIRDGRAVVEVWTRGSTAADGPRFHGPLRPAPFPAVIFTQDGRVTVRAEVPALARRDVRAAVDLVVTAIGRWSSWG